ncbi:putative F-box domain-containing protein [Tanacetum coccineum]|uniref:F-box domain-containing protein n=1 Tax=Tanacetum coccineum TaxID=301880 RepID=A0ABQ5AQB0_9ASTR
MSDHIPFEIQSEIMERLPIKSLIQFRCVSKPWKSLIDSSKFITNYHRIQQHHHLLVSYANPQNISDRYYVSIVDDDTFPQQKFSLTVPASVNQLNRPTIVGSSQGLVCFYDILAHPDGSRTNTAVIWNPVIKKSVTISVPDDLGSPYSTAVGFGVTPDTSDPKLVKVSFDRSLGYWGVFDTVVEVFTLSTMAWKRLTTNLPRNSTIFEDNQVVIDRFTYWRANAYHQRFGDPHYKGLDQIMSFDMIAEEFNELDLPDSFACNHDLFISKARESLVVVEMKWVGGNQVLSVWMMEHGDPKSLTKKFTINTTNDVNEVLGSRKSGEPLIGMIEDDAEPLIGMREDDAERDEHIGLCVYESCSGHINSIGITDIDNSCNEALIGMIEDDADAEPEHVGLCVYEPGHINSIGITEREDSCNDYDNGDIANVDDNRLLLEQARLKCSYSGN